LQKVFQLSAFKGDHGKCLKAAVRVATAFARKHPKLSRREFAEVSRPRKDGDSPVGVRRVFSGVKGRFYNFYEATWSPTPHRQKKKRFSVNHYGEPEARALAIKARRRGLKTMQD
jgi:AP2 domain